MSLIGARARNHPQQDVRDDVDDRTTLPELFDPLHARFGFTIDVAAAAHNARLERFYSRADDGLAQDWTDERVWCNPPYSDIEPWVAKASDGSAQLVVMLVPANRTEQGWWQRLIEPVRDVPGGIRCEFLAGRIRFGLPGAQTRKPNDRPPFGVCLLIWGEDFAHVADAPWRAPRRYATTATMPTLFDEES